MNIFKVLDKFKKERSLILYSLLNRIPIFVFGDNSEIIDEFIIELSSLIHFRAEYLYFTDFISNKEYRNLFLNEEMDYNSQRILIRCSSDVSLDAIMQFPEIKSTLMSINLSELNKKFEEIKMEIEEKLQNYLCIFLEENRKSIEVYGITRKEIDLSLEDNIFQRVSESTDKSINKMKRVLSEKINKKNLDQDFISTLLDFDKERMELKKSIFKEELQKFYSGSKRAFYILLRLNFLNSMDIDSKIASKTLLETIDFIEISIDRIISFIKSEWNENFIDLVENNRKMMIGDKLQSMWG
ncbi:MAG: hypothetical protein GF317_01460 [Candidatus Lokiarchaeota archaeon]|nr:hypothetical protein [Candidatus Lokiarchaeota archaeon]MBD3198611.1 hypothetical protein [Candidatus Lokiarchaeota archaeon]